MEFAISTAAAAAKKAARQVAKLSAVQKNALLTDIATSLLAQTDEILKANEKDIAAGRSQAMDAAMLDRLTLTPQRIEAIASAVKDIAGQADPVGAISQIRRMPSGIQVGKMRIPLGVIAMIYESRPNVTIDAAALCLKAGNAVILRGGKEAIHSNLALAESIKQALHKHAIDAAAVVVVPDTDRQVMNELLTLSQYIDLVIPRGGEGLIRFVSENSRIPVIQHFKGVCHLYVEATADHDQALNLLENGKTQRTGVCNALETLLVEKSIAPSFLPKAAAMLAKHHTVIHACERSLGYFAEAQLADESDWHAEYLAMEIAVRVVDDFAAALAHIEQYGSGHTEVIATQDYAKAQRFIREIDSAVVMVNASSRFSDGGQLGLGAEIGISTSKLHAYGPMGAESLTTEKFIVMGEGEIRQ
jgi:glutamate-5-semialdehyde dehydrogenase